MFCTMHGFTSSRLSCCITGKCLAFSSHCLFISSGFLGNPLKTGFVYVLGLESAQSGNLKD